MHTDQTLELLDNVTILLGEQFRIFISIICPAFKTRELPREATARARRSKKPSASKVDATSSGPIASAGNNPINALTHFQNGLDQGQLLSMPEITSSDPSDPTDPSSRPVFLTPMAPSDGPTSNNAAPFLIPTTSNNPSMILQGDPPMADPAPLTGQSAPVPSQAQTSTRRLKTLNLDTYKYHSLGDYADMIRRYGTTDSYSTEIVSKF